MVCWMCKNQVDDSKSFCPYCGSAVSGGDKKLAQEPPTRRDVDRQRMEQQRYEQQLQLKLQPQPQEQSSFQAAPAQTMASFLQN